MRRARAVVVSGTAKMKGPETITPAALTFLIEQ